MIRTRLVYRLLSVCLIASCLPLRGQDSQADDTAMPPGVKVLRAVPFAQVAGRPLLADIYLPAGAAVVPGIVFIHGGGWRAGDRTQLRRQAIYMAAHGMAGMAPDYRLAPAHPFPAALEDSRAAVAWFREHAAEYHVDPSRIAVAGSSAGGHLAAMLGVETDAKHKRPTDVAAVVAFNGIYDLNAMPASNMVSDFAGGHCAQEPAKCIAASPIDHIGKGGPPFLLLHGTADMTAPFSQATTFAAALKKAGYSVEFFTAEGAPHTFWAQKKWIDSSFAALNAFLQRALAADAGTRGQ
jgi:acetyl esterase/lipase